MNREKGNRVIEEGHADLVSFGTLYIQNNDIPEKFAKDIPLVGDFPSYDDIRKDYGPYYYGQEAIGYTDLSIYHELQNKVLSESKAL